MKERWPENDAKTVDVTVNGRQENPVKAFK